MRQNLIYLGSQSSSSTNLLYLCDLGSLFWYLSFRIEFKSISTQLIKNLMILPDYFSNLGNDMFIGGRRLCGICQ